MSSLGAQSDAESWTESDAVARDARARRRTWVIGGMLLVLSAVIVVVRVVLYRAGIVGPSPVWAYYVKDWLWGIGALILVIGLGRAGSITGRRPISTVVVILQIVVAAPVTSLWLSTFVLDDPQNLHAEEDSWAAIFMPYYLAVFALTLTAALLIARARAVPTPWNWAPMWMLGATGAFGLASWTGAYALSGFSLVYLPVISTALLGILAIVLGVRAGRSAPADTGRPLPEIQEGSASDHR